MSVICLDIQLWCQLSCQHFTGGAAGACHRRLPHCIMYNVHCTLYAAHLKLHAAHCTLHISHCTLHTAHCTLHTSHCTLHTAHYIFHTAHCTLHKTHGIIHTAISYWPIAQRLWFHAGHTADTDKLQVSFIWRTKFCLICMSCVKWWRLWPLFYVSLLSITSLVTVLYTECGTERKEPFEVCAKFKRFPPFCADAYCGSRTQATLLCTTLQRSLVHLNAYILIVQHIITKINMHKCIQCTPVHLSTVNDTSMTSPLHEGNLCNAVQKLYYFY